MRKLGSFQQQIYDYIKDQGTVYVPDIYSKFSPFKYSTMAIHGYFQNWRVQKVLSQLEEKELIVRTDYNKIVCRK
jgi:hypothetical protein